MQFSNLPIGARFRFDDNGPRQDEYMRKNSEATARLDDIVASVPSTYPVIIIVESVDIRCWHCRAAFRINRFVKSLKTWNEGAALVRHCPFCGGSLT